MGLNLENIFSCEEAQIMLILSSSAIGSVPFTPHIMGHVDEQTRRKMQGKLYQLSSIVRGPFFPEDFVYS